MNDTTQLVAELVRIRASVTALIDGLSGESEKPERKPPPEIAERLAANLCIRCGEKPIDTRGLCSADYQGMRRMVREGHMTDEEAVEQWKWLPPDSPGRKSKFRPDAATTSLAVAAQLLKTVDKEGNPKPPRKPRQKKK